MRTLSVAGQTAIDNKFGGEPVQFIEILWSDGVNPVKSRHADKEIPGFAIGDILELSSIEQSLSYNGNLVNHQFDVTLDDSTGRIKAYMNTHDIQKRPCVLYQWFTGIPTGDAFEVFRGQIYGPITWDEGSRQVSFTVLSPIYGREVGFSLEEGQFENIPEALTGRAWPMCFGSVINVPCQLASDIVTGAVGGTFGRPDVTLPYKRRYIENQLAALIRSYGIYTAFELQCHLTTLDYDIVEQTIFINGPYTGHSLPFTLSTSGLTSDVIFANGVNALQVELKKFLAEATDKYADAKDDYNKFPFDLVDVNQVVSFTINSDTRGNVTDIVIEGWPYPITVASYDVQFDANNNALPVSVTCVVTKVSLEDGTLKTYDELVEAILTRPEELRKEYIDLIKEEDGLKQDIEDLNVEMEKTFKAFENAKGLYTSTHNPLDLQKMIGLQTKRDDQIKDFNEMAQDLYRVSHDKKKAEINIDNISLMFDTVGKIRAKQREITKEYANLHKQYSKLLQVIEEQSQYLGSTASIQGYQYFNQGSENVSINGVDLRGTFSGNSYTYTDVVSPFSGVAIDPNEQPDIDTFWLLDPDVDIKGHYCRLPNGRILKVTEQVGRQCRFQPVLKHDSTRNRAAEILPTGQNMDAIKKALGDLLSGGETTTQLLWLASNLPTDISYASKLRLTSAGNKQVIALVADAHICALDDPLRFAAGLLAAEGIKSQDTPPTQAWYKLKWGGKKTNKIYVDWTPGQVQTEICRATDLKPADIIVTIEGGRAALLNRSTTDSSGNVEIEFVNPTDEPMELLEVVEQSIQYIVPQNNWPQGEKHTVEIVSYYQNDSGAQEYTDAQRVAKIQGAYNSSAYGDDLQKIKTRITALLKQVEVSAQAGNNADTIMYRNLLASNQTTYQALLSKVQLPKDVIENAFRYISLDEYKNIFQCELLQHMYIRRYIDAVGNNVPDPRDQYYFTGYDITYISETCPILQDHWLTWLNGLSTEQFMDEVQIIPESQAFVANVGDTVTRTGSFQQMHVANMLPSTVMQVRAYKNIDGHKVLVPVPSSYYEKDESFPYGTLEVGTLNLTTITVRKPLSQYKGEDWEDTLYVSLVSSVGPNPVDVIEYLVENYTNFSVDASSFTSVRALVDNYPTNFALLDKKDSLQLIDDIAFQSRCAVWVAYGKVYITYLPFQQTPSMTITRSDILVDTFKLEFTDTDSIVTKSVSKYMVTYDQPKPYNLILRANLKRYGEQVDDYDYYCLTNRDLVLKSATFWLIQKSTTWKIVKFSGVLNLLKLEPFDLVTLDLSTRQDFISNDPVICRVIAVTYDSSSNEVNLTLWVPIRAGEMDPYLFAWPSQLSVSDVFPLPSDVLAGNAGTGIETTVPTGVQYNPFDSSLLSVRPKDYGDISPTDLSDVAPISPTTGLAEDNAIQPVIQNFQIQPQVVDAERFADVEMGAKPPEGDFEKEKPGDFGNGSAMSMNGFGLGRPEAGGVIIRLTNIHQFRVEITLPNGQLDGQNCTEYNYSIKTHLGQTITAHDMSTVTDRPNGTRPDVLEAGTLVDIELLPSGKYGFTVRPK